MNQPIDKDTRYFIDIDRHSMKIIGHGFDQKQNLNRGQQTDPELHRLFLTPGQYRKLTSRCASELDAL